MNPAKPPLGILGKLFLRAEDERVYAAVRIGFALVALCNLVLIWPWRGNLLSSSRMIDLAAAGGRRDLGSVLLFHFFQTPAQVSVVMCLAAGSMLLLLLGIWPRLAATLVFLWHLSFIARSPMALAGWDMLLRAFSFLLLVSPMGRCWTLPALWKKGQMLPQQVARYGLVLMQLQVMTVYFQTVVAKLVNPNPYWRNGELIPYFLLSHFARWPDAWVAKQASLLLPLTYLALLIEVAIPVMLFVKRTRFWGALLGLLFHGFICVISHNIGPFTLVMGMTYLAFLTGSDVQRLEAWLCSFARTKKRNRSKH